ncbi:mitochondrial 54S ribosomal protein uL30m Ecym_4624 [Eremothecium cymbalariae DBVPG|uniref:Large ribosomal subunit protein uL30m n=1 Tax=Eremothecium cymbalariae (strain CBS 270.75 / DBVPG 7215 / KCTC 17166 / NRRL Y-17582) TaxID=931890 RepID=G8JSD0_ERECY|nr:hypothetical protein Ecym_4624 [Eremothecium cymbalariae DBVPG\
MVFYKIVLSRSTIGMPAKTRAVVKSLGLGKRGSVVYHSVSPTVAGAIAKVKELVNVEVTDKALSKEEQRQLRTSNPGYTVEKRL